MSCVKDLASAIAHLRRAHPRPATLAVSRRAYARIKRDMRALTLAQPSPRPPPGDPDRWLWEEHRKLMELAEVRVLGTLITTLK